MKREAGKKIFFEGEKETMAQDQLTDQIRKLSAKYLKVMEADELT